MPFVTAVCGIPVIASILSFIPALLAAIRPESADLYAVFGAIPASICTLVEARKKDRSTGHTISVFLGSSFMGATLPAFLHWVAVKWGWMSAGDADYLPWQVWSVAGFLCAMNAWFIIHSFSMWLEKRRDRAFGNPPHPY